MATYYVRQDGNDSNTGLGSTTGLAWRTIQKALGATGIGSGDTVYIAPGHYNETVTIGGTYSVETQIIGDPTASQFSGLSAGFVRHSQYPATNNTTFNLTQLVIGTSKSYLHFKNIYFEIASQTNVKPFTITGVYTKLTSCVFVNNQRNGADFTDVDLIGLSSQNINAEITNCIFYGLRYFIVSGSLVSGDATSIKDSCFINSYGESLGCYGVTASIYNCLFYNGTTGIRVSTSSVITLRNSIISNFTTGLSIGSTGTISANNCRVIGNVTTVANSGTYTAGSNSVTVGTMGIEFGYSLLHNLVNQVIFGSIFGGPNTSFGTATGAPSTDLFGVAWSGTSPDAGAITNRNIGLVTNYLPTERNASTITIAPGSTSQSIELYLGATGLTASTSGLSARYNRTRTASVSIPLVARTIAQAWTSGGFAEVDATNMPGVYRLDLPDAALAAGADDVTIVVRGASGTNGAVMTVKLSSGGLTASQTASAVWDEAVASHITAGTFGLVTLETNQFTYNNSQELLYLPGLVWDEAKANHTIPNTFGDYLDTKVSTGSEASRIQLRQGPFLIKQNAIDSVITEVNQFLSTVPNIEMVLIDSSGGSVSVAGSTLVMRVRNQAGTAVVNNVTPTVAYADGGVIRWSPNLSWNALGVTTAGTYRIVVERTMSSVTTTFGPFLVQLSSG